MGSLTTPQNDILYTSPGIDKFIHTTAGRATFLNAPEPSKASGGAF